LGYQSKSIVNKIIKLFYVFMLASIEGLANSTHNKENKKRKEYGDITFRFVP